MNNILNILNRTVNYLEKKNIENARLTSEKILSEVLGINRIMLYANFEKILNEEELNKIKLKLIELINEEQSTNEEKIENDKKVENVKTLIDKSISYLEKNEILESKLITEMIFSKVLEVDRMMLFTKYRDIVEGEKLEKIRKYIQKVGKEKFPVQYLLNEQQFYGRNFYVNKGVLIPRQDTEVLVEKAINIIKENKIEKAKILDIGVGSGVIGITLALEIADCKVMGVDVSDKALEISEKNKKILNVANIKFFKSNLFENVEYNKFNIIISNPPYIPNDEINLMTEDTILHEPDEALFAENEGLYFYNEISKKGLEYLRENGFLLFEIGYNQGEKVKKIMEYYGYKNIEVIKDFGNNERVVLGQK